MAKKIFHKLDGRNTGFGIWKYSLNKPQMSNFGLHDSYQKFYEWRNWCWQTWGPSKELPAWLEDIRNLTSISIGHNEQWCWQNDQFVTRIYLRTDKELSMFLLKWSQ